MHARMRISVGQYIHSSDLLLQRHAWLGRDELEDKISGIVVLPALHCQGGLEVGEGLSGRAGVGEAAVAGQEDEVAEEVVGLGGGAVDRGEDDASLIGEVLEGLKDLLGFERGWNGMEDQTENG